MVLLVMLLVSWLGSSALDKRGERKRQRAVQDSHERPQQNVPLLHSQGDGDTQSKSLFRRSMLSVGRETDIREKDVVCRSCSWEGIGSQLSTGLVRIENSPMFLFAYRCPACAGFELSRKGKLLAFSPQDFVKQQQAARAEEPAEGGAKGSLSQWK